MEEETEEASDDHAYNASREGATQPQHTSGHIEKGGGVSSIPHDLALW